MNLLLQNISSNVVESPSGTLIGIGVAAAVAATSIFWAGIHLRGKTYSRLFSAVGIAKAGLTEEAMRALRVLQAELAILLSDVGEIVNPDNIFADPTKVERNARMGIRVLKQRDQLPKQFEDILQICKILGYLSVGFTAGIWLTLLAYALLFSCSSIWHLTLSVTIIIVVVGIYFLTKYVRLNFKIQNSIELANPVIRD